MSRRKGPTEKVSGLERAEMHRRMLELGLNFTDLAERAGEERSAVSKLLAPKNGTWKEGYRPSVSLLTHVRRALDLPPKVFAGLNDDETEVILIWRDVRDHLPANDLERLRGLLRQFGEAATKVRRARADLPRLAEPVMPVPKTLEDHEIIEEPAPRKRS